MKTQITNLHAAAQEKITKEFEDLAKIGKIGTTELQTERNQTIALLGQAVSYIQSAKDLNEISQRFDKLSHHLRTSRAIAIQLEKIKDSLPKVVPIAFDFSPIKAKLEELDRLLNPTAESSGASQSPASKKGKDKGKKAFDINVFLGMLKSFSENNKTKMLTQLRELQTKAASVPGAPGLIEEISTLMNSAPIVEKQSLPHTDYRNCNDLFGKILAIFPKVSKVGQVIDDFTKMKQTLTQKLNIINAVKALGDIVVAAFISDEHMLRIKEASPLDFYTWQSFSGCNIDTLRSDFLRKISEGSPADKSVYKKRLVLLEFDKLIDLLNTHADCYAKLQIATPDEKAQAQADELTAKNAVAAFINKISTVLPNPKDIAVEICDFILADQGFSEFFRSFDNTVASKVAKSICMLVADGMQNITDMFDAGNIGTVNKPLV
jgi:tetrahydromethanopterin S-methyltransferase subunit G